MVETEQYSLRFASEIGQLAYFRLAGLSNASGGSVLNEAVSRNQRPIVEAASMIVTREITASPRSARAAPE